MLPTATIGSSKRAALHSSSNQSIINNRYCCHCSPEALDAVAVTTFPLIIIELLLHFWGATDCEKRHRNTSTSICLLANCLSNRFIFFVQFFCSSLSSVCFLMATRRTHRIILFGAIVRNNIQDSYI